METNDDRRTEAATRVRGRIWLEWEGAVALGPGRARLLEAIEEGGSITHAASVLGVSYRTAWNRVERLNTEASAPLVATRTGGPRGGGARLTSEGQRALAAYRVVEARTREALDDANREVARLLAEDLG